MSPTARVAIPASRFTRLANGTLNPATISGFASALIPPEVTLCLFRVVQEALQNAVKYSHARQVSVNLTGTAAGVVLTVADDGVGFDVEAAWGKGLGLISIGERLEAIGGTFRIQSEAGSGTRLEVVIPPRVVEGAETVAV